MKTVLYRNVEVLFSPDHEYATTSNQDKLVMVFALVSEFSENKGRDYWRIEFVGPLRKYLLTYCPSLSDAIRDGEIACTHAFNEATMLSWLFDCAKCFKVSTPEIMHNLDHFTYFWSDDKVSCLENTGGLHVVQHKPQLRILKHLDTDADIVQFFDEAKEMSKKYTVNGLGETLFNKHTPT